MRKGVVLFALAWLAVPCAGATYYIDADGTGDYPTIYDAVNAARDGDEVVLADGTYELHTAYMRIDREITVRSENGPENCIIDCNGSPQEDRTAFRITSDATIAGITIINGYSPEGGAILCFDIELQIVNCILRENFSKRSGGAIYCHRSNTTIINCRISI